MTEQNLKGTKITNNYPNYIKWLQSRGVVESDTTETRHN